MTVDSVKRGSKCLPVLSLRASVVLLLLFAAALLVCFFFTAHRHSKSPSPSPSDTRWIDTHTHMETSLNGNHRQSHNHNHNQHAEQRGIDKLHNALEQASGGSSGSGSGSAIGSGVSPQFGGQRQKVTVATSVSCGGHWAASCSECPRGNGADWCHGQCVWLDNECRPDPSVAHLHPAYLSLLKQYPFQPVRTDGGQLVNIILVRAPFSSPEHHSLFEQYKDEILFLGICSYEDFPLPPDNPFSQKFPADKYVGMFPGWLEMFRPAISDVIFPPHVKHILMSQSDFNLPSIDDGQPMALPLAEKKYDFVFSGTDQDVAKDCVGWSSFAKNWTFVVEALEVMCTEYSLTGVLVATKDKQGIKACKIPASCSGKVLQTSFLRQDQFFEYVRASKFAFVPQIHDASPRAAAQALALNVPVLMNRNIRGGWKYVNEQTGQFFNDLQDFRASLDTLMNNVAKGKYAPRQWMQDHYGNDRAGKTLKSWVEQNWPNRVTLPKNTRLLIPSGA